MELLNEVHSECLTPSSSGAVWVVRLKPYEDVVTSLRAFAAEKGVDRLAVLGCVGSLMHATLLGTQRHVRQVQGPGVEIVAAAGWVDVQRIEESTLTLTVADRQGTLFGGRAAAAGNPVCVTAELVVQDWS